VSSWIHLIHSSNWKSSRYLHLVVTYNIQTMIVQFMLPWLSLGNMYFVKFVMEDYILGGYCIWSLICTLILCCLTISIMWDPNVFFLLQLQLTSYVLLLKQNMTFITLLKIANYKCWFHATTIFITIIPSVFSKYDCSCIPFHCCRVHHRNMFSTAKLGDLGNRIILSNMWVKLIWNPHM